MKESGVTMDKAVDLGFINHKKDLCDHEGGCSHGTKDSCICFILCKLAKDKNKVFRFRTKSGDEIIGNIECFDRCTGCVVILQPEVISPKLPAMATILSCSDIESISFDAKPNH